MVDLVSLLKFQGRAVHANLLLGEGYHLPHAQCLKAIAVMHGHRDWGSLNRPAAAAKKDSRDSIRSASIQQQAKRLAHHTSPHYGPVIDDAIEATRSRELVELLTDNIANPH